MTELTDEKGAKSGFLMVVLNIHVDDMDWLVALLLPRIQIYGHTRKYKESKGKSPDNSVMWK